MAVHEANHFCIIGMVERLCGLIQKSPMPFVVSRYSDSAVYVVSAEVKYSETEETR